MNPPIRLPDRLFAYAAIALAAAWALIALATWGGLQNGVRVSSPFSTFGYGQAALFSSPVSILHVVATVCWNVLAMLIGYAFVVRPIWGGKGYCRTAWLVFAGVIPGMLLMGALTRLVTLFAQNPAAATIAALLASVAGAYAASLLSRDWAKARFRLPWRSLAAAVLALLAALVFQVHIDRGHAVAEGSIWFMTRIFLSPQYGVGTEGYFPLFPQHYDEAAFLYPLIHLTVAPSPDASATLTLIYWLTLAVSRVGMIALSYIGLRGLKLDSLSATVCTAFLCAASLSLNPFSSRVLFDSLSPMLYTLHMSRFLAPVLPVLIVSAAMQAAPRVDPRASAVAFLLGIGLAALPIHFLMIAAWAVALFALAGTVGASDGRRWGAAAAAAAFILFATALAYALQAAPAVARAGLLVAAPALGFLWIIWQGRRDGIRLPVAHSGEVARLVLLAVGIAGYGIGLALMGNIAIGRAHGLLDGIWPWSNLDVVRRLDSNLVSPGLQVAASPFCAAGYEWGYRTVTGHCGSMAMFVRTYGLPFAVIAAVLGWRALQAGPRAADTAWPHEALLLWSLVLCLLALPISFALFDFVTPKEQSGTTSWSIWLRSRLPEPWFVSGTMIALACFLRHAKERARNVVHLAMVGAIAIHFLNPLIGPAQWVANVAYWVNAMVR